MEETGFPTRSVHALGSYAPCTARLSNRIHSFFVETGPRANEPKIEASIELKLATLEELAAMILAGEFALQLACRRTAAGWNARPSRSCPAAPEAKPLTVVAWVRNATNLASTNTLEPF